MKTFIEKAIVTDASEILALQKVCYRIAILYNDYSIEPLVQSLEGLEQQFNIYMILKAVVGKKLIGSVRAYVELDT
ncbi:hypothetical protein [Paenibacillus mendelii]|uniref:GNAT family N-acetyltransferase n=1 Tax=Paenibacillus mendelii TaxID=206163 RepID=A0ABV6J227_9BACL|nr:hypothetical protein [Paenibacillus mendelii]MCQ6562866.1 hypothetical protein [Paenibacillus mendelii]